RARPGAGLGRRALPGAPRGSGAARGRLRDRRLRRAPPDRRLRLRRPPARPRDRRPRSRTAAALRAGAPPRDNGATPGAALTRPNRRSIVVLIQRWVIV